METSPHCGQGRWIDLSRDLNPIADLLAVAFAERLDEDGRAALRQLRRIARSRRAQRWYSQREVPGAPVYGFVWECKGRIVGNVSLIPLDTTPKQYLIVNVAVLPAYRRRGIAHALMQQSLAYARQQGASRLWLQVDTDNHGAIALYRRLGFVACETVTLWQLGDSQTPDLLPLDGFQVRSGLVRRREWARQLAWLHSLYPPERAWHLPLPAEQALAPTWRGWWWRLLHPLTFRQGIVRKAGRLQATAVWLPRPGAPTDAVLFAAPPDAAPATIVTLTSHLRTFTRRPLRAELPRGAAEEGLRAAGFQPVRHLLWMLWRADAALTSPCYNESNTKHG